VAYDRYTRVFYSRLCCNLYTKLGDSVNDYGGKEKFGVKVLRIMTEAVNGTRDGTGSGFLSR